MVFGLALLVHLPVLLVAMSLLRPTDEPLPEAYEIEPIQLSEETPDPDDTARIVSLDKPEEPTEAPEDAKVEDRYDQKVDKETVRKRDGRIPTVLATPHRPTPTRSTPAASDRKPTSPDQDDQPEPDKGTSDEEADKTPDGLQARSDTANTGPLEVDPGKNAPDKAEDGEGDTKLDLDPNRILPNWDNTVGTGGSGPKDYLEVEEGDNDLLNRKETRYWAFFDRVRTSVRRQWQPNDVYRANDPRGQIYGVQDRLTILRVTLKGDGSLQDMYVEKPSGLAFLDNEAMRAFRVAQPFSNPPEALKDDEGLISFRFGFMFEIQSSGGRIIRYSR